MATAAAPCEDKEQQKEEEEKEVEEERGSDSAVKTDSRLRRTSLSRGDNEENAASPSSKRDGSKKTSKRRSKKGDVEEGEESASVDSESDSDSSYDRRDSHSRSDVLRSRARARRRRSPVNPPPGDSQSKIPTLCRHYLNGKPRSYRTVMFYQKLDVYLFVHLRSLVCIHFVAMFMCVSECLQVFLVSVSVFVQTGFVNSWSPSKNKSCFGAFAYSQ